MVPLELDAELRKSAQTDADLLAKSYRAAFLILRHYLGTAWVDEHIKLNNRACSFMLNDRNEQSEDRFTHMHRVIALGDSIFGLRCSIGLEHLCQRFLDRDVRPCYFEANTAAQLNDDGFAIEILRETGCRGSDFDLSATRANETIAVEVRQRITSLQASKLFATPLMRRDGSFPRIGPVYLSS